jgi:hypothetical protein
MNHRTRNIKRRSIELVQHSFYRWGKNNGYCDNVSPTDVYPNEVTGILCPMHDMSPGRHITCTQHLDRIKYARPLQVYSPNLTYPSCQ